MLLTLTLPTTSAPLHLALVALSALAAVCAFAVALTLLDLHERARRNDAEWRAWRASPDAALLYAYYLEPQPLATSPASSASSASPTSSAAPTLPSCARVVAYRTPDAPVARSQRQGRDWRDELV